MKAHRTKTQLLVRAVLAVLAGGSLLESGQGCSQDIQRELEVLNAPEANATEFYNSYLMQHSWGQQLVKWWNGLD